LWTIPPPNKLTLCRVAGFGRQMVCSACAAALPWHAGRCRIAGGISVAADLIFRGVARVIEVGLVPYFHWNEQACRSPHLPVEALPVGKKLTWVVVIDAGSEIGAPCGRDVEEAAPTRSRGDLIVVGRAPAAWLWTEHAGEELARGGPRWRSQTSGSCGPP
jgi:hypothetical protein